MGLPTNLIEGALRIGIGKFTTREEIEQAASILSSAVSLARQTINSYTYE
ncbi:hypothetical protein [Iningainema tapete]|nr:hypothetical protein [Iningainema tapete]